MGYAHYFTVVRQPTADQWTAIAAAMQMIYKNKELSNLIQFESDDNSAPIADERLIRFNGVGEAGHETFYLSLEGTGFQFCKTARKPYDNIVTAALVLLYHFAPGCYNIGSDGEVGDWIAGREIAEAAAGVGMKVPDFS